MSSKRTYVSLNDDGVGRKGRPSRFCFWMIAVSLVLAVLIIIGLAAGLGYTAHKLNSSDTDSDSDSGGTVCDTESCMELSKVIIERMDTTFDPCVDFYNYSCGMFDAAAAKGGPTASLEILSDNNYNNLSAILNSSTFDTENTDGLKKLKTYFDSCTNTTAIERRGVQPLLDLLKKTGGWSVLNVTSVTSGWDINGMDFLEEKLLGSPAFYGLSVQPDGADSDQPLLQISQSGLTLGEPDFYTGDLWDEGFRDALIDMISKALVRLNPLGDRQLYNQTAMEIADFEYQLAQIFLSVTEESEVNNTYNVMTLKELSEKPLWQEYDWQSNIQRAFNTVNVTVDPTERINVETLSYFKNLSAVYNNVSNSTIENYSKWQFVSQFLSYVDNETRALHKEMKRRTLNRVHDERGVECVQLAESVLPLALARPFVEKLLPKGNTDTAAEMVNDLKTALRERMGALDWMDDYTKERVKEKVDAITSRVGYPGIIFDDKFMNTTYEVYDFNKTDFFGNNLQFVRQTTNQLLLSLRQPVDRGAYDLGPTVVNAYYYPPYNQITILAGIMMSPLFRTDWPSAFRFGALGGVVGHELTHGFDNNGRRFNAQGNLEQWWSQNSIQNFTDLQECFVKQYSTYSMFGRTVNGQQTLSENIADNGGLKASFQAFQNTKDDQTLAGLSLKSDQIYFVAWAQQWCTYYTASDYIIEVLTDVHSPGPFRVIGPMVNNADFAAAFNCPAGSPMNPTDKCLLW